MPMQGYHYIQRRRNIESFDSYGFPQFGPPTVKYVGCDKKRRFITRADKTEIWLCGPLRCSLQQTFISPWVAIDTQLDRQTKELQEHDRATNENNGDARAKAKSNGNRRGPG